MHVQNKTIIIIGGPTAAGKTAIAIEIARHFKTEIISADSRQCFKELNIGVARPSIYELSEIKHHFIASHSIQEKVSAAIFEKFAIKKATELLRTHEVVVMAGGTGLYIKAFCEGLDEMPEIPLEIRNTIMQEYEKNGMDWLRDQVAAKDPAYYAVGEIKNPQRLMRALEVAQFTGKSVMEFRKGKKLLRPFRIIKIGIELPKEMLHFNIRQRLKNMLAEGLVEEVRSLLPFKNMDALNTVGYKEIFQYLDNTINMKEAEELIEKNTRHYAKRQLTWFKKDKAVSWFSPNTKEIMQHLSNIL